MQTSPVDMLANKACVHVIISLSMVASDTSLVLERFISYASKNIVQQNAGLHDRSLHCILEKSVTATCNLTNIIRNSARGVHV